MRLPIFLAHETDSHTRIVNDDFIHAKATDAISPAPSVDGLHILRFNKQLFGEQHLQIHSPLAGLVVPTNKRRANRGLSFSCTQGLAFL